MRKEREGKGWSRSSAVKRGQREGELCNLEMSERLFRQMLLLAHTQKGVCLYEKPLVETMFVVRVGGLDKKRRRVAVLFVAKNNAHSGRRRCPKVIFQAKKWMGHWSPHCHWNEM